MQIQGTLTVKDYREFLQMNLNVLWWNLSSIYLLCLMVSAFGGVALPFIYLFAACAIIFLFPELFISATAPFLFSLRRKLQGARQIEVTAHGLIIDTPAGSLAGDWKQRFTGYRLGDGIIVVYQPDRFSQIFAKRWFTDRQLTDFLAYLRTQLGPPRE